MLQNNLVLVNFQKESCFMLKEKQLKDILF